MDRCTRGSGAAVDRVADELDGWQTVFILLLHYACIVPCAYRTDDAVFLLLSLQVVTCMKLLQELFVLGIIILS